MSDSDLNRIPPLESARFPRGKYLLDQTFALVTAFSRNKGILVKPETGFDGDVVYVGVSLKGQRVSVSTANDIVQDLASFCARIGRTESDACKVDGDILHCGVVTIYDREVPREKVKVQIVVFPSESASMTRCGLGLAKPDIELSELRGVQFA